MTDAAESLGLYTPQQILSNTGAPYLKARQVDKWLKQLPIAHLGEISKQIYKALTECNRTIISNKDRLKLLEAYVPYVEDITTSLKKHFLGQALPLSSKAVRTAELCQELQWEMANGYKIIIENSLGELNKKVDSRLFVAALWRAMNFLYHRLLVSYLTYAPNPERVWLEIHHIYLFAEHNALENFDVKITEMDRKHKQSNTLLNLYKEVLLLSLSNPYRLPQKEIEKVHAHLAHWAQYTSLHRLENPQSPNGLFSTDLLRDKAPGYYIDQQQEQYDYIRILNTDALNRLLRDQIVDQGDSHTDSSVALSQQSLRRLILSWGAVPKRSFSRVGKNQSAHMTLGLSASHHFISQSQEQINLAKEFNIDINYVETLSTEQQKRIQQNIAAINLQPQRSLDAWAVAENPSLQLQAAQQSRESFRAQHPQSYLQITAQIVNESLGGLCLHWRPNMEHITVVGSIIAIQKPEQSKHWQVGAVRWLKATERNSIDTGIELLASETIPVYVANKTRKAQLDTTIASLLLPEVKSIKQPISLITSSLLKVGDKVDIIYHTSLLRARLVKILEYNNTFSQFAIEILRPASMKTANGKLDRVKNFDSIWSSL